METHDNSPTLTTGIETAITKNSSSARVYRIGVAVMMLLLIVTGALSPDAIWAVLAAILAAACVAVAGRRDELSFRKWDTELEASAVGEHAVKELAKLARLRERERRKTQRLCIGLATIFVLIVVLLQIYASDISIIPTIIAALAAIVFALPALGATRFRMKLFGQSIEARGSGGKK